MREEEREKGERRRDEEERGGGEMRRGQCCHARLTCLGAVPGLSWSPHWLVAGQVERGHSYWYGQMGKLVLTTRHHWSGMGTNNLAHCFWH